MQVFGRRPAAALRSLLLALALAPRAAVAAKLPSEAALRQVHSGDAATEGRLQELRGLEVTLVSMAAHGQLTPGLSTFLEAVLNLTQNKMETAIMEQLANSRDMLISTHPAVDQCFQALVSDLTAANAVRDSLTGWKADLEGCIWNLVAATGLAPDGATGLADPRFSWQVFEREFAGSDVWADYLYLDDWDYLQGSGGTANTWVTHCETLTRFTCQRKDGACDAWEAVDSKVQFNMGPHPDAHMCDDHSHSSVGTYFETMWQYWQSMSDKWDHARTTCSQWCDWCEGNQSQCPVEPARTYCPLHPPAPLPPECPPSPDPPSPSPSPDPCVRPPAPPPAPLPPPGPEPYFSCDDTVDFVECHAYTLVSLTDACPNCYADPVYNFSMGQEYDPTTESDILAAAIDYCKDVCMNNEQCTGFYFQKQASGHEVCGFLYGSLAYATLVRRTNQLGSQVCKKVPGASTAAELLGCREKQDILDREACNQATMRIQACNDYSTCSTKVNQTGRSSWRNICAPNGMVSVLREEYLAVQRIECLITAINTSDATRNEAIEVCRNKTEADYNLSAVSIPECDVEWPSEAGRTHPDCMHAADVANDANVSGTDSYRRSYYQYVSHPAPCRSSCCEKLPSSYSM